MPKSDELTQKLKQSDPEVQGYISALESENAKLQIKIARLEAQNVTADHRIAALEQSIKENKPEVHINIERYGDEMNEQDLRKQATRLGFRVEKIIS